MAPSSSSSQELWLSAGLFVIVALASQVLQNQHRQYEKQQAEQRQRDHDYAMGHRYSMKRMTHDGWSKENLNELVKQELKERRKAEENIYEFQPKNSNWNHFETEADEDDLHSGMGEEEFDDEQDDDDDGSTSSGEEFLWTNSSIRGSLRKRRESISRSPTNSDTRSSWTTKLKESSKQALRRSFGLSTVSNGNQEDSDDESDAMVDDEGWRNVALSHRSLPRRQLSAPTPVPEWDMRQSYEPQVHNRVARRRYNARIMPNKVIMIRHGQSMGNINEELYSTTSDNAMPLTKLGWEQARKAGQVLKEQVLPKGETVHFIVSPYVRTVETFHGVVSAWCDPSEFKHIKNRDARLKAWYSRLLAMGLSWHEDPRIREQDFGNYQDPESIKEFKRERHRFGSFFYRFPHGESASDVFDRVSTFLDSLWRSFYLNKSRNYVLITHGISIRVLLARYFRYTIAQFQMLANPKNCEMVILKHDGAGRLQLEGRIEQTVVEGDDGEKHVTGSTFHERLRVVPSQYIPKTKIRISYDD